ncbi:MAG: hypothetical protein WCS42_12370, partial [Verrucomicrobiota bacterium]
NSLYFLGYASHTKITTGPGSQPSGLQFILLLARKVELIRYLEACYHCCRPEVQAIGDVLLASATQPESKMTKTLLA